MPGKRLVRDFNFDCLSQNLGIYLKSLGALAGLNECLSGLYASNKDAKLLNPRKVPAGTLATRS